MRTILKNNIAVFGILGVSLFTGIVMFRFDKTIAVIELVILAALTVLAIVSKVFDSGKTDELISSINSSLEFSEKENLKNFPMPVLVCSQDGRILWYNTLFDSRIIGDYRIVDDDVSQFLSGHSARELASNDRIFTDINENSYSVFPFPITVRSKPAFALLFSDETEMRRVFYEYRLSRPSIMLMSIDNLDEIMQSYSDGDFDAMRSTAEKLIDTWLSGYGCLVRKLGDGRFVVVCEERDLEKMVEKKFDILDTIRSYEYDGNLVGITLSIGIGKGETMRSGEVNARQALDMAVGRGGDQAAILKNDGYEFFGGVSKGVEKRSKARTRIVASAIQKLIESSSEVFIMGHCYSDLDSIGAAVGMRCAAQAVGKAASIVINRDASLARALIEAVEKSCGDVFCTGQQALEKLNKNSLVIIVDTHRCEVLESEELYKQAKTVVIIDHHRKNVDYINDAIVFQHDPNASSACEMVAEMLQYMPVKPKITAGDADALLAGIMLDTRNFALKTGVRTFEAAAYLRSKGADTVKVRKMFVNKMDNLKQRNEVIATAQTYRECAIAFADIECDNLRMITSQVADELLNIDGVAASFAMFESDGTVNISARSLGEVNVQVIMEALGGGGHLTMAAAQLHGEDRTSAVEKLHAAIDSYFENR